MERVFERIVEKAPELTPWAAAADAWWFWPASAVWWLSVFFGVSWGLGALAAALVRALTK